MFLIIHGKNDFFVDCIMLVCIKFYIFRAKIVSFYLDLLQLTQKHTWTLTSATLLLINFLLSGVFYSYGGKLFIVKIFSP